MPVFFKFNFSLQRSIRGLWNALQSSKEYSRNCTPTLPSIVSFTSELGICRLSWRISRLWTACISATEQKRSIFSTDFHRFEFQNSLRRSNGTGSERLTDEWPPEVEKSTKWTQRQIVKRMRNERSEQMERTTRTRKKRSRELMTRFLWTRWMCEVLSITQVSFRIGADILGDRHRDNTDWNFFATPIWLFVYYVLHLRPSSS